MLCPGHSPYPTAIKIELNEQVKELVIASNARPTHVKNQRKIIWGQAVPFNGPKPIAWTPNSIYRFKLEMDLAVPVISTEMRANLARYGGVDEVSVPLIMPDGRDQFKEENIMLRR
jgi:hypothetical protein